MGTDFPLVMRAFAVATEGRFRIRINGGVAQTSGSFTEDEAKDLAIVLRVGALPAPVRLLIKK